MSKQDAINATEDFRHTISDFLEKAGWFVDVLFDAGIDTSDFEDAIGAAESAFADLQNQDIADLVDQAASSARAQAARDLSHLRSQQL